MADEFDVEAMLEETYKRKVKVYFIIYSASVWDLL